MSSPLTGYIAGTQDPTSVATYGERGWLFIRLGASPGLYQKITTDANDTNWQLNSPTGGSLTGTGVANRLAYWDGVASLNNDADLTFDPTNNRLALGTGNTFSAGNAAFALGSTNALGASRALAVGENHSISAAGTNSAVFGDGCSSTHARAFLQGEGSVSGRAGQAVVGAYNALSTADIFQVGTGTGVGTENTSFAVELAGKTKIQNGFKSGPVTETTTAHTADADLECDILLNEATTGVTVTLPTTPANGTEFFVKDITGSATPTHSLAAGGADTIEGAATFSFSNVPYRGVRIVYDSGVWYLKSII